MSLNGFCNKGSSLTSPEDYLDIQTQLLLRSPVTIPHTQEYVKDVTIRSLLEYLNIQIFQVISIITLINRCLLLFN